MYVIAGTPAELPAGFYSKVANYRHRVFVERLGWPLQSFDGAEHDQFDRDDTVYVVSKKEHGEITGCARLLPTTQPYLLAEVFPQLLNGMELPNSPDIWELSRFASVDFNAKTATALSQFSSSVTIKLLREAIACAMKRGAKRVITVSPIGIERLLKLSGLHAHRAGPPMIIDGHPIFACWIEIEQ
ncbi:GNAT family N-acetyltransferase [Candidatus Methylospira mobilis]|uniref:Acyl-homoserine-lactone synthase n=1 Tax=Candidatus Methylospira mobilis TaxID=1808979 RepID=A0A5Q0BB78_9GAMM|nr:acyl-homoserine-lactone synthase [Candidatus Methylospira mobilis]QFY41213.1 GNAT family N-acetyltransferase [Candidatus Methylospira mobilis]WNV05562.1 acyl-homoserine-lactone synthase [Candidatus Methylospira mobilis]